MITAVLDVNVVVAAVLAPRGATRQILSAWRDARFCLVTSEGIVAEIGDKLRDPKVGGRYGVGSEDAGAVRALLLTQAEVVAVRVRDVVAVTGDAEDDYVLATTRLARAHYLVTGDRRLLALGQYAGSKIVSPREFLNILERTGRD